MAAPARNSGRGCSALAHLLMVERQSNNSKGKPASLLRTGLYVHYPLCTISGANAKGNECEDSLLICKLFLSGEVRRPSLFVLWLSARGRNLGCRHATQLGAV